MSNSKKKMKNDQEKTNPCLNEQSLTYKCLDQNGYKRELCEMQINNYKLCKTFWEHMRTELHYNSFVEAAKHQYKRQNEEEKTPDKGAKKRKAEDEGEPAKKQRTEEEQETAEGGDDKGGEMYDPEEACQETEGGIDNATLDEEIAEVERLIKTAEEDQDKPVTVKEEPKEQEEKKAPEAISPRGRRSVTAAAGGAAAAAAAGGGPAAAAAVSNVKNGAGPKSKTRRGAK